MVEIVFTVVRDLDRLLVLRRSIQITVLAGLPLLPLMGWAHIDVKNGSLVLFGLHVWAHEATLVVLVVALGMALLAGLAAIGGRLFCGWICPQTALSELASYVEKRIRRADSRLGTVLAAMLGIMGAVVVSAVGGLSIVTFFVPTSAFAGLFGSTVNTSLAKGSIMATIIVFVVVVVFRHNWCEWICVFGLWQRLFGGSDSLRIVFDVGRSRNCTNCGACKKACFMKLEPRERRVSSNCLNCAKCVTACERELGAGSLIGLKFQDANDGKLSSVPRFPIPFNRRLALAGVLIVVAASAVTIASASRQPIFVMVSQAEQVRVDNDGVFTGGFHVDVYNNHSQAMVMELEQKGLHDSQVKFSSSHLTVGSGQRARVDLAIAADLGDLAPGRRTLIVKAVPEEGAGRAEGRIVFVVPPSKTVSNADGSISPQANIGRAGY